MVTAERGLPASRRAALQHWVDAVALVLGDLAVLEDLLGRALERAGLPLLLVVAVLVLFLVLVRGELLR